MARPLRLEHAGAIWHVHNRGNNFGDIFFSDEDRILFLELLGEATRRFHWVVIQYSLMTNHYHLLLETPEQAPTLSRGMKWLAQTFVQRINKRHGRVGSLFQGRFKAHLIEDGVHLLEVIRYIANNPVAAGLVNHAEEWPWGSHRALAGYEPMKEWMSSDPVLAHFGRDRSTQVREYRNFVSRGEGIEQPPWAGAVAQLLVGSDAWVSKMRALIESRPRSMDHAAARYAGRPRPSAVVEVVATIFGSTPERIRAAHGTNEREVVAWIGCYESMSRLGEIATVLRLRSTSRVASLIRICEARLREDRGLQVSVDRCLDLLRSGYQPSPAVHLESQPLEQAIAF